MNPVYAMTLPEGLVTMTSWARAGYGAESSAYKDVPPYAKTPPTDFLGAYDQGIYLLALACRRAQRNLEKQAASQLLLAMNGLMEEREEVYDKASWICVTTGYWCPEGDSTAPLTYARKWLQDSGLNPDDTAKILVILNHSINSIRLKRALPFVALVGAGAIAGTWWFNR